MRFVVGRYYFDSLFKEQADKTFTEDLSNEPYFEERSFEYALGDFHWEEHRGYKFLRGTFGKIRKTDFSDTYDKKSKLFKKEPLKGVVDTKIEFLISHKHHLIFIEYHAHLNPNYVADKFVKIYNNHSSVSTLEIDYIIEEKDVYETIKSWDRLEKVHFRKLRPSNPSSLDDFHDIEELLKETNSDRTDIELKATKPLVEGTLTPALNYESKLIKQALALSSHGYGEGNMKGKENGEEVEVSTSKFIKKVEINFQEDGSLDRIIQTIEEVQKGEND